ncbi:uncharacterized protein LOC115929356 [Strongylocentrotus purpuratus]|uniref:Uncharacterized protein n=1 Tax=Strongylocentrotus purpuratus TaxID=7668 RepID=A0A7M7PMC2_STRPU|nr:uncharacterized protein LOC115929032 [Strongylocentrotus purpuratus]XP_030854008.1 uncharacterized protein LOC115929345 [Strongylocentrotus purpuratus]XP_030854061.1 uncharacterized protein LOC115929356 [Strongylocentrotus purpuratus]
MILKVSENIPVSSNSSCSDQSGSYPCCDQSYELLFFIPVASQATPPTPSQDSGVTILHLADSLEFYGITYVGENHNAVEQYEQLRGYLNAQGKTYFEDWYFIAAYDKPTDPQPHRNEIMVLI